MCKKLLCLRAALCKATQNEVGCHQVLHLPHSGAAPWATNRAQARHQPNATSATPATQNEGGCHQVPCLPRKVARRPWRLSAPKRATRASPMPQVPRLPRKTKVDVAKCHACHEGGCRQVPRVPREAKVDVTKCHACHAKWRGAPGDYPRPSAPPEPSQFFLS